MCIKYAVNINTYIKKQNKFTKKSSTNIISVSYNVYTFVYTAFNDALL